MSPLTRGDGDGGGTTKYSIIVSNREEYLDRPTSKAAWHSFGPVSASASTSYDNSNGTEPGNEKDWVLSGRDLSSGGTWLGITRDLRVAVMCVCEPSPLQSLHIQGAKLIVEPISAFRPAPRRLTHLQEAFYSKTSSLLLCLRPCRAWQSISQVGRTTHRLMRGSIFFSSICLRSLHPVIQERRRGNGQRRKLDICQIAPKRHYSTYTPLKGLIHDQRRQTLSTATAWTTYAESATHPSASPGPRSSAARRKSATR